MTLTDDITRKLVRNERIKLTAAYLNSGASAFTSNSGSGTGTSV